jgi:hypothetical protein
MYLNTFDGLGLTRDQLKSRPHPFYEVVSEKQSVPLGQVTLPVTFKDASNYRPETLTFEVVDFSGPYHVILGRLCYVMFKAIPSETYLKLKTPGPTGIVIPRSEKEGTKPPYVCPGCSNHTYSNNMITRFHIQ